MGPTISSAEASDDLHDNGTSATTTTAAGTTSTTTTALPVFRKGNRRNPDAATIGCAEEALTTRIQYYAVLDFERPPLQRLRRGLHD